jgi:hypothetical protein
METQRSAGRREAVPPGTDLPEELTLDVSELGPRALAVINWLRETPNATAAVTRRGRPLARLVPVAPLEDDAEEVDWHVEAIAP